MILPDETLYKRLEAMPGPPNNEIVWHLCTAPRHQRCAQRAGSLAIVYYDAPHIPEVENEEYFLMRLHPPSNKVLPFMPEFGFVRLPSATSFPFSTVWSSRQETL